MDLLKGITEELQGRGEPTGDGDRSETDARTDSTPEATPDGGRDPGADAEPEPRDDEHVCDFCGTDFDADRGACPDCGAELVFRGRR
ncbi:hypothetical protein NGM10_15650 (plasmid) [Halorussus salilacus]|uniref:hypothetical protein n=1 Tax=Halorussus salilacus TaxID=2953750 RepID=UPI0020A1FFA0|nr:hypothetical protein [Halorussus salilacus]USZ69839.1 hypothetical protein NGM10_15650 [Halorussus salilacus]